MEQLKTLAVSGHRPPRLGGYHPGVIKRVNDFAFITLAQRRNDSAAPTFDYVAVGMAQGWDLAIARACVLLEIPFVAYVAFPGVERRWPASSQRVFQYLCGHAANVVTVGNGRDVVRDLMRRNAALLENAVELLALCYDVDQGGTADAIRKAVAQGVPVRNAWLSWELFNKQAR